MAECYVFDIDNTLTPPRQPMTEEFADFFIDFCATHEVYLVTGSSVDYIAEQIPSGVLIHLKALYPCSGTVKVIGDVEQYRHVWEPNPLLFSIIGQFLNISEWPHSRRYEHHIEHRGGMVNFSVLGRHCPHEERGEYFRWDQKHGERKKFARILSELFPDMETSIGGEISVDIMPKGNNKAMILDDLSEFEGKDIIFFGDKCSKGGNDYPLSERIKNEQRGIVIPVVSWYQTLEHLKNMIKGAQ